MTRSMPSVPVWTGAEVSPSRSPACGMKLPVREIRAPTITSLTSASVVAPMAIVMSLVSLNSKGSSLAVMRMKATGIFEPVVGRA